MQEELIRSNNLVMNNYSKINQHEFNVALNIAVVYTIQYAIYAEAIRDSLIDRKI